MNLKDCETGNWELFNKIKNVYWNLIPDTELLNPFGISWVIGASFVLMK